MSREESVIAHYVLCQKLKNVIRSGWKIWHVNVERLESVAEHVYGATMLAVLMHSEFQMDVDLNKVVLMLAVHELGEIKIGDIPMSSPLHATKQEKEHQAVHEILSGLINGEEIESFILEFDERKTKEAQFAYYCDKLECDLQAKLYGEMDVVDLDMQQDNPRYSFISEMKKEGVNTFSELWFLSDMHLFDGNDTFQKVFQYARTHSISQYRMD